MKEDKKPMNYDEFKGKKINVADLSDEEVKVLILDVEKRIKTKQKELEELNEKIRKIKIKIDNWNN